MEELGGGLAGSPTGVVQADGTILAAGSVPRQQPRVRGSHRAVGRQLALSSPGPGSGLRLGQRDPPAGA